MIITGNNKKPYSRSSIRGTRAKKWINSNKGGKNNNNWITIHSDASYSFQTNISAFAFRIKSSYMSYKGGDVIEIPKEEYLHGPGYSEIKAIIESVTIAIKKHRNYPNIRGINIVTDSSTAIDWLKTGSRLTTKKSYMKLRTQFHQLIRRNNIYVRFIKIEAHSARDIRNKRDNWKSKWANEWCDKESKRIRKSIESTISKRDDKSTKALISE